MKILKTIFSITESHYVIVGLALFLGIFYADYFINLSKYSTLILAIIFFLSSLKIDLSEVRKYLSDKRAIFVVNILMLFVLPVIVFYLTNLVFPSLAIAFLLLASMPSGMTAPLLSEIAGGKQSLALVLTVTTSILAPITAPLIIKFLIGAKIDVSFWDMFITLATVIYIPFVIAQLVKRFWQSGIDKVSSVFKPLSVLLLGFLIVVVIAKQSAVILDGIKNGGEVWIYLGLLFVFFILLHVVGYFLISWKKDFQSKVTIIVCVTYMNFTLAIELANNFFDQPNIVIPVVFSVIPWSIMLVPFKYLVRQFKKPL